MPLPLKSPSFVTAFLPHPPTATIATPPHWTVCTNKLQCERRQPSLSRYARALIRANFVSWQQGGTNPRTVRTERARKSFGKIAPVGFTVTPPGEAVGDTNDQQCVAFDLPGGPSVSIFALYICPLDRPGERGQRRRSTRNRGVDKSCAQSPVCPKPFVVMCHTPARQTASQLIWPATDSASRASTERPLLLCGSRARLCIDTRKRHKVGT